MTGFEDRNIDAQIRIWNMNIWTATKEKSHFKPCNDCVLKDICSGPRKDYVKIYGFSELKTIKDKKVLSDIIKRIKNIKLG